MDPRNAESNGQSFHSMITTWETFYRSGYEGLTGRQRRRYENLYGPSCNSEMVTTRNTSDNYLSYEGSTGRQGPSYENMYEPNYNLETPITRNPSDNFIMYEGTGGLTSRRSSFCGQNYNSDIVTTRRTIFLREEEMSNTMSHSGEASISQFPSNHTNNSSFRTNARMLYVNEGVENNRSHDRKVRSMFFDDSKPTTSRLSRHSSLRFAPSDSSIDHLIRYFNTPLYQHFYVEDTPRFLQAEAVIKQIVKVTKDAVPVEEETKPDTARTSFMDLENTRALVWGEMPQVIKAGILEKLTPEQTKVQHIKFEFLTSEASYYSSLAVLEMHFSCSLHFYKNSNIISKTEHKYLFGNVASVRKVSEKLVRELHACFERNVLMNDMPIIILKQLSVEFGSAYVKYCRNLQLGLDTYDKLRNNEKFAKVLDTLEADKNCQNLKLNSFLILPMQRILRMPLLVEAILAKLPKAHKELRFWQDVQQHFKKLTEDCNSASGEVEDIHKKLKEMNELASTLHFPSGVRALSIVSATRTLLMSDSFRHHVIKSNILKTKKHHSETVFLYLFNDYLLVTKSLSAHRRDVLDYCAKEHARMEQVNEEYSSNHCVKLTLQANHQMKYHELILEPVDAKVMDKWLKVLPNTPRGNNVSQPAEKKDKLAMNKGHHDETNHKAAGHHRFGSWHM